MLISLQRIDLENAAALAQVGRASSGLPQRLLHLARQPGTAWGFCKKKIHPGDVSMAGIRFL